VTACYQEPWTTPLSAKKLRYSGPVFPILHWLVAQVYHPCILQTKKRYVGFAYESPNQTVPVFDAKVRVGGL
jgi:hypothetical protein